MAVPSRLRVETLESRDTPTVFATTHVLVTTVGPSLDAQWAATLRTSPVVADVSKVGDNLFRAELVAGVSVATAVADLGGRSGVAVAQPDYKLELEAAVTPNDPQAATAWQNTVTSAAAAWGVSTGTGSTVVAVIDSGVFVGHPDLAANVWRNPREAAGNGVDDDGNGYTDDVVGWNFAGNNNDVSDNLGHGTHAAGILGAVGGNGLGVAGVNWHARIMPLKIFDTASGGLSSDAVRAIDYAVANGARVINESWGGGVYDPALAAATARARAAGVVVVAAAGNGASDNDAKPFYPAGYAAQSDNVVSVAATTPDDTLAAFSNYGRTAVTLAAPGQWINSTLNTGGYGEKSGTSMAAPFVAGAVSLLWDANPTWTYRQVIDRLTASVDTPAALAGKVATGRLNLAKLLSATASPPPAPSAAVVAQAVIGGPKAGSIDRAWVRFSAPVAADAVRQGLDLGTPLGTFRPSSVQPVAGTNNTQFTVLFSRTFTTPGVYRLSIGGAATATRFTQDTTLGSTPVPPPIVVSPPVAPPAPPTPAANRTSVTAGGLPTAVRDGRTTRVELYVSAAVTARDVSVQLSVQHARVSDLSIRLTAPDGRKFTLFNRRGGAGANLDGTTFTDSAAATLATAAAPFAGAVRPEQSLATLNGASGRGLWVVEVFDLGAGVSGTLTGVTLSFTNTAAASAAWATSVAPAAIPVAPPPPPTPAVVRRPATDEARPDAVAVLSATKPTPVPARPADVTGWLVNRLRSRIG